MCGLCVLVWLFVAQPPSAPAVGFVWPRGADCCEVYQPREGDLIFFTNRNLFMFLALGLARTGHPHHAGIVVGDFEGRPALLEAGCITVRGQHVALLDVSRRLHGFVEKGDDHIVWVRRVKRPLTPDESARLSGFAWSQLGKPYASCLRLALIALPGHPGGGCRPGQGDWYCSELAAAALFAAGLWPAPAPPAHVVPADLFFGRAPDCLWEPPARWTPGPCPPTNRPWFFLRERLLEPR